MPKLTKKFVDTLSVNPEKHYIAWDSEVKGFGVRVMPSGRKTYLVRYRSGKQDKKMKLGVHGAFTAEQARARAKTLIGEVTQGRDPGLEHQISKAIPTMSELAEEYLEKHASRKRKKSQVNDRAFLNNIILPAFGNQRITDISRRDLQDLHLKRKETPYQANRLLAILSKMFSLAVSWGYCSENPVVGIERFQELKRDRWLDEKELDRLLKALEDHRGTPPANVIHFLILTGARRGEALNATWDQFDLEKGLWVKPAHTTKQKKTEHLPLSELALDLLKSIREKSQGHYLFPGKKEGEPLKEIKRFWAKLIQKAELKDVRIHDLRHTHASHLVSKGVSLTIVGKLLGHTQAATTQRYAHLANSALREAANQFAQTYQTLEKKRNQASL